MRNYIKTITFTKVFSVMLILIILFSSFSVYGEENNAKEDPLRFIASVENAVLYHVESKTIMYEKSLYKHVAPSVTTKMMVALVALEALSHRMDEEVTIPSIVMQNAIGTHMELWTNEVIKIKELFHGLIMGNANDAAYMLALLTAENNIDSFVNMMNNKAAELGMKDTKYVNITGNDDPEAYTTAYDVLLLTVALSENNIYSEIAAKPRYTVEATNKKKARDLHTKNYLLSKLIYSDYYYQNANGLCGGTTGNSGNTVCATAEINNSHYIAIAMNGTGTYKTGFNSYLSVRAMFENLTDTFAYRTVVTSGTILSEIKVELAEEYDYVAIVPSEGFSMFLPVTMDVASLTYYEIELNEQTLTAPVEENQVVGQVNVYLNADHVVTLPLITLRGLTLSKTDHTVYRIRQFLKNRSVFITIITVILLSVCCVLIYSAILYQKNKKIKIKAPTGGEPPQA